MLRCRCVLDGGSSNKQHHAAGDLITEEALPTYMAMLNTLDGVRDLSDDDLALVLRIGAEWQATYQAAQTFESAEEADWHLARLLWFAWWIEWALHHTTHPSLAWSS